MQQRTRYSSQLHSEMSSVWTSERPESSWTRTSVAWAPTGWTSGTGHLSSSPSAAQPRCVPSARNLHGTQRGCCRCCPCCTWTRWWSVCRGREEGRESPPRSGPAELYRCCAPNRSEASLWRCGAASGWRPPCHRGRSDEPRSRAASHRPTGPEMFLEKDGRRKFSFVGDDNMHLFSRWISV